MKVTLEIDSKFLAAMKKAAEHINVEANTANEDLIASGRIIAKFYDDLALTVVGTNAVRNKLKEFEGYLKEKGCDIEEGELENFLSPSK